MFEHLKLDKPRKLVSLFGEPVVLHCHHYNTFLQQTIEDPEYIDGRAILQDSSQEISYQQLSSAFEQLAPGDSQAAFALAQKLFRFQGFGTIDIEGDSEGGVVHLKNSHYAIGWKEKYGGQINRQKPVCHYAVGFAAALFDAAFAQLGTYSAIEERCAAVTGEDTCVIRVSKAPVARQLVPSPKMGKLIDAPTPMPMPQTSVDYDQINEALWQLPLEGNEQGLIRAFNSLLTRMPGNYYTRVQYRFLDELSKVNPGLYPIGEELIRESGHVCVFYTLGSIMQSVEWDSVVAPMLKDEADWVHGAYAVGSSLGWGRWQALEVTPDFCKLGIDGNYETNYYMATYPLADAGRCYLAQGSVSGMMNLVYNGKISENPILDEQYYNRLFKRGDIFHGKEVEAREQGDPYCVLTSSRD